jgi:flagellar biosynthesis protein FliR
LRQTIGETFWELANWAAPTIIAVAEISFAMGLIKIKINTVNIFHVGIVFNSDKKFSES